jgi:hypothetical protein
VSDLFTTCGVLFLAQFAGQWLNFAWMPVANRLGRSLIVSQPVFLAPYILFAGLAGAALPFVLRSTRPVLWSVLVGVLSGYAFALGAFARTDVPEQVRREVRFGNLLTAGLCLVLPIVGCLLAQRLSGPRIAASGA